MEQRVTCMGAIQLHQIPLKDSPLNRIEWNYLFTHCKIHQEYENLLNKPNYPKQYA